MGRRSPLPLVTPSPIFERHALPPPHGPLSSPPSITELTLNRQTDHRKATACSTTRQGRLACRHAGHDHAEQPIFDLAGASRSNGKQRNLEALEISPKINGILANRANKVLQFEQAELGSGQLVWNDSTGDFVLLSRGLPKNVAMVQIRLNEKVMFEQAYQASGGQFQADVVEQSALRNTDGQTVTVAFLDQDGTAVLTRSISVS